MTRRFPAENRLTPPAERFDSILLTCASLHSFPIRSLPKPRRADGGVCHWVADRRIAGAF